MMQFNGLMLPDSVFMGSSSVVLFHDFTLSLMVFILSIVLGIFYSILNSSKYVVTGYSGSNNVEIVWTLLPSIILLSVSLPSLVLMYCNEGSSASSPELTMKTMSHQWYWSYEGSDLVDMSVDSYMKSTSEMVESFRLLEVDNSLVLPYSTSVRLITSSTDVIHSWTLPSLFLKVDCVPGRMNTLMLFSNTPSSFYSQCSEICSVNHSFMPIHVEFVDWLYFLKYVTS